MRGWPAEAPTASAIITHFPSPLLPHLHADTAGHLEHSNNLENCARVPRSGIPREALWLLVYSKHITINKICNLWFLCYKNTNVMYVVQLHTTKNNWWYPKNLIFHNWYSFAFAPHNAQLKSDKSVFGVRSKMNNLIRIQNTFLFEQREIGDFSFIFYILSPSFSFLLSFLFVYFLFHAFLLS